MNPYQVLGVSQTADEDTIKKAYRKAAKECHPDTHPGDKRAEERFKEIGEAYRILSDKQKREEYNARATVVRRILGRICRRYLLLFLQFWHFLLPALSGVLSGKLRGVLAFL